MVRETNFIQNIRQKPKPFKEIQVIENYIQLIFIFLHSNELKLNLS
jgi:hypothetical protein